MAIPPPDVPYDLPQTILALNVRVHIVGYIHEEPDCEVLASGDGGFFRFYVPKSSRVIRKFWQHIGVTNVLKLEEGAYESKIGLGPFNLTGMAIGEDTPTPVEGEESEEGVESVSTKVLIGVQLEG